MDKKIKMPPEWGFSPTCDPQSFFKNRALVTFVPLWCPNFMQQINERSLRYLKTDRPQTDGPTRAITTDPSGEPGVQNGSCAFYQMEPMEISVKNCCITPNTFNQT